MSLIPANAEQIEVNGATVPFYKYEDNGITFLQFDSSKSGHPEPMVNAMCGLKALKNGEKLVMFNSKAPMGLFPKVEDEFSFEIEEIQEGLTKIIFSSKSSNGKTDFNDTSCNG
ncbi:MAG: hypothetical protein U9R39_10360 [Campylobacterota bacterium]|nr:hypothetical protein [Campylobacterota bacterium]